MAENLRLARLYFVLLGIFAVARLLQGLGHVPYEKAHHVFSIVTLTFMASIFYGAFCRRWRRFRVLRAAALAATMGLASQIVIFVLTVASYALGLHTFFNHAIALNAAQLGDPGASSVIVPFGEAMGRRLGGLIVNPLVSGVAGALGWTLGVLLPENEHPV